MNLPFLKEEHAPSLNNIQKGFSIIDSKELENMSYEDLKELFIKALGMIPKLVAPENILGVPIYRVTNGLYPNFDKHSISAYSHPPVNACRSGRANLQGYPVLYASLSGDTALREFRNSNNQPLRKGDVVYISEWEVDRDVNLVYSQFIYDRSIRLPGIINKLNKANYDKLNRTSIPYSPDKQNAFRLLIETLSKYFISDHSYQLSSFIAHYILYEDREHSPIKIDAILYPSVQAGFRNLNFAFHPEFVRRHIKLKSIQKVSFLSFGKNKSNLDLLAVGLPGNENSIKWRVTGFNTRNIRIDKILVSFQTDPPLETISDSSLFFHKGEFCTLHDVTKSILNDNIKPTLNELAKFDGVIDLNKTYQKDLSIKVPTDTLYMEIEQDKYYVETIAVKLSYRLLLLDSDE